MLWGNYLDSIEIYHINKWTPKTANQSGAGLAERLKSGSVRG